MWPGRTAADLGRLVVAGGRPHRWPVPGARRCAVEAVDIDRDAGLGAVLIVTLPFRGPATAYEEVYEHDALHGWVSPGGASHSPADRALARARPSAARSGPAVMLSCHGGSAARSHLERLRLRESGGDAARVRFVAWINTCVIDTSVEVDHLLVAGRRVPASAHGRCVIVWKSAASDHPVTALRPPFAAVDRGGRVLTELGPCDALDTLTRAFLDELA